MMLNLKTGKSNNYSRFNHHILPKNVIILSIFT